MYTFFWFTKIGFVVYFELVIRNSFLRVHRASQASGGLSLLIHFVTLGNFSGSLESEKTTARLMAALFEQFSRLASAAKFFLSVGSTHKRKRRSLLFLVLLFLFIVHPSCQKK
jgi:hypothetical protein